MGNQNTTISKRGPGKKATAEQILQLMESYDRPVWTVTTIADELAVSRPTVQDRLQEVEARADVQTIQVGNTTAYYVTKADPRPIEEQHKDSIIEEFTDKFVGLPKAPWTAVHPKDGTAEAGDRVQIRVEGVPGRWRKTDTHLYARRREKPIHGETYQDKTQALITGRLYGKPTTPIEHSNYRAGCDLEVQLGAEIVEKDGMAGLIAAGPKSYLLRPCNDALEGGYQGLNGPNQSEHTDANGFSEGHSR